ncbi:MAG: hypothetical protein K2R93_17165 [Gemmatimonadaceae bacterium]|nr:hypothetical protein [Gemmatimonadaceae bacterium]
MAMLAMRSQDSAHRRQASAHCCIIASLFPRLAQARSQARQASAQSAQTRWCRGDPRSMKSADVWHILAQSSMMV